MELITADSLRSPGIDEGLRTNVLFRALGPLEVQRWDGEPVAIGQRKKRRLLSMLLLHAGGWVGLTEICAALWEDEPPRSAPGNIKTYVSELRHALPPARSPARGRIESWAGRYRITVVPGELDVSLFETAARRGREARRAGAEGHAVRYFQQALELWRGRPFDELPEDVTRAQTARLEEQRWVIWEDLIDARLALGQHDAVLPTLRALTIEHPHRERIWGQLLVALDRAGRRAEALDAYQTVYRLLADELGIEPGVELQRLHRRVLAGEPEADRYGRRAGAAGL
jgi:SARP family transcriptional regulator, regulator of embCAB operon